MLDFLRNLLDPLFNLMGATLSTFHGWGAPWWLAIVMLTIVVRTLLFPITYRQVKSMRRMQDLKPDMDRIRAEYKDDVQKQRGRWRSSIRSGRSTRSGDAYRSLYSSPSSSSCTTRSDTSTRSRASGTAASCGSRN